MELTVSAPVRESLAHHLFRRWLCHGNLWCCQYIDTPLCNGSLEPHRLARWRRTAHDITDDLTVRRGITRTVLLAGQWAIKLPSLRAHGEGLAGVLWSISRGILANQSECDFSGQPGLCPVLWSFAGVVNVYPRCEPVEHELTDDEYAAIGFAGPVDKKPPNVGLLDGRMVWLDYDQNWNDQPPCQHVDRSRA